MINAQRYLHLHPRATLIFKLGISGRQSNIKHKTTPEFLGVVHPVQFKSVISTDARSINNLEEGKIPTEGLIRYYCTRKENNFSCNPIELSSPAGDAASRVKYSNIRHLNISKQTSPGE